MSEIISRVQSEQIDVDFYMQALNAGANEKVVGAELWFFGNVRKFNEGEEVSGITYEAHGPMAEKIFVEICKGAREVWGGSLGFVVVHRVGYLKVGECSVLIGVSSPHRDEAYQASRFIIEEIKKRAPVWKQEHYSSGGARWLKGEKLHAD